MEFVGNYAPCGLSPQTDGMPVILKNLPGQRPGRPCSALRHLDRILLYPINVWVTENSGNPRIQPEFVADALQTANY